MTVNLTKAVFEDNHKCENFPKTTGLAEGSVAVCDICKAEWFLAVTRGRSKPRKYWIQAGSTED